MQNKQKDTRVTPMKSIVHIDEKELKPGDVAGATRGKTIIGRPNVYDLKGNLLASEENLVVLLGREFLAQQISGKILNNPNDYSNYKITHFGVGDGGTTGGTPPVTVGPFDNDLDLENRVKIGDPVFVDPGDPTINPQNYMDNGFLKKIESADVTNTIPEGEIVIMSEEHTINTNSGGQITVGAYTAVRYTMYLQATEPQNKPFRFNEAGLYAVEYEVDGVTPTGNYILFARFTTLDKYLEDADGIMIEWYVLV